ncbi:glycoside hydrolase family 5 protein [Brevundimonas sp. Leaf363]|uniref:glycoside hydrolase family 5 protein n=1 Tax=Brevundimonas sp. Leaf363 TaxID=1736353 RepID=UPI0009EC4652|nr:glycoside hydrolase family 5 protein [Brevundimonas sp. Leaf363]
MFTRRLIGLAALLLAGGCAAPALAQSDPYLPISAEAQVLQMQRGVNIIGYDPVWNGGEARFQHRHFKLIRDGGFQTVRMVLQAFRHMDAGNQLNPRWLATLDGHVDAALAQGLTVILDEHDFNICAEDVVACRPKLMAFWEQISTRYANKPNTVVFELMNEPNGATDAVWNDYAAEALAIVRRTNPTRNVIIGPGSWNSIDQLENLRLPAEDRHIIATVHYYGPMRFTHQGASWTPMFTETGIAWGSPEDRAAVAADLDKAEAWSEANGRPLLLGEFGAYDKAPMASRAAWTDAVARAAETRGWAWAYWQFDSDFIVYDIPADRWVQPIHEALIPEMRDPS